MPIRYCSRCWAENAWTATTCQTCGEPLTGEQRDLPYEEKLLIALRHPEPDTRARAAELLGRVGDPSNERLTRALRALLDGLSPDIAQRDMGAIAAAATALGTLGVCAAAESLSAIALNDAMPLYPGLTAVDALGTLARAGCPAARSALDDIAVSASRHAIRQEATSQSTGFTSTSGGSGNTSPEHHASR